MEEFTPAKESRYIAAESNAAADCLYRLNMEHQDFDQIETKLV